ncbi:hypothetical protein LCGC14_2568420, partial [marine sediment metagenome]
LDILVDGNMPEFESDADRFVCASELGTFINTAGTVGMGNNILKLLGELAPIHSIILLRRLKSEQLKSLIALLPPSEEKQPEWKEYIDNFNGPLATLRNVWDI